MVKDRKERQRKKDAKGRAIEWVASNATVTGNEKGIKKVVLPRQAMANNGLSGSTGVGFAVYTGMPCLLPTLFALYPPLNNAELEA